MNVLAPSPPFDVAIVGAGPAGITVARKFAHSRDYRICLIESGSRDFSPEIQDLARGENAGLDYLPLDACRFRRFGGSLNGWPESERRWPTVITPMTTLDFEQRSWVRHSGWPFGRSELNGAYERARSLFPEEPAGFDPADWETDECRFRPFDPRHLETCIWHYSPGTNFGRRFARELRDAVNIVHMLETTAVEVLTDTGGGRAIGVRVARLDGRQFDILARIIILACGGIENPRLLLASNRVVPAGLGNRYGLVGRYFMEHPHVRSATVRFVGSRGWLGAYKRRQVRGMSVGAGIRLSEAAQRHHEVLNYSAILIDDYVPDAAAGRASSGYAALKEFVSHVGRGRLPPGADLRRLVRTVGADLPATVTGAARHLRGLNCAVFTRSEQAPNPDSRVSLGSERDPFGHPRAKLEWRLTSLDKRTIRVAVQTLDREFVRLGLGRVVPEPWLVRDDEPWPPWLWGGAHHMGTTRMAATPRQGVVDPDCQVFGVTNLYVAGSSVFPTGGYANPTLTLVALADRLADHLHQVLSRVDHVGDALKPKL